jgi:tripartite-type tricarboxylate transporter receptor subunit TctC
MPLAAFAAAGPSANYPSRPIRLVVPQNPGGGTDLYARLVALPLSKRMGQSIVIDNRAGAGSLIGTDLVAKAVPDGYTLLAVSSAISIIPSVMRQVPFDVVRDFAPVSQTSQFAHLVALNPGVPANSIKELITLAKARPGTLNFGSAGNGTPTQLAVELFKSMTGVDIVHVPYSGGGPGTIALISGQVQMNFGPIATLLPHVKSGKVKALAVTTAKRSPFVPELPTVAESGVPGYEVTGWNGMLAPAAMPTAILKRVQSDVAAVLKMPEIRDRMALEASEPGTVTGAEFGAMLKAEVAKWAKVVKQIGLKPE